ncbi:MAG: sigma-70 family RNA polymerase sigma factor [Patescibacteria group bacterium]|nr:sigma-70 family RNA polymerase sigma factor [Patescibacteria group bacterium]
MNINPGDIEKKTDQELVELTLGDQDYFLYIVQRYKLKIFSYIKRITNICDEDAEDVLQEVFLKTYLNLNGYDPDLKFSSWLYSIARHEVISRHRKTLARPEGYSMPLDDELINRLISGLDMQKSADRQLLKDKVSIVLGGLKEKFRDILVLKFIEDKSYQEISDIIKKPVGTVGSMLDKAKKEFRDALRKMNINL